MYEFLIFGGSGFPLSQARTIGISGLHKIGNVVNHVFCNAVVCIVKGALVPIKCAEDIVQISGMEGAK